MFILPLVRPPSLQMESFVSDAPSTDPIYDLPTWLQNNAPQHDTRPKSPFYHWQSWMSHSLPLDQQRTLLAFDEHMGVEASRGALTRQAQFVSNDHAV